MTLSAGTQTQLETSVYGQCLNRVITDLISLDLPGIGGEVYFVKKAWHESLGAKLPCATVSWAPETSTDTEGPMQQSIVHYRVMIAMVWAANRDQLDNAGDELLARQQVAQLFRKKTPAWTIAGATIGKTAVIAGEPLIREATLLNLDAQFLIIDCQACEPLS